MPTRVYIACTEPLRDDALYARLYDRASQARKQRIDRYRNPRDRMLSLGAEALVLHALKESGYDNLSPAYTYGSQGKPYLAGLDGFFFNLSHSGGYVMLAVSDAEIGCDIQRIRPVNIRVAKRVLTPAEYESFEAADEADRSSLFCRYWVAKESYLKATGRGLAENPASVRIELEPSPGIYREDVRQAYALWEGSDIPGYRCAVCREGALQPLQAEIIDLRSRWEENETASDSSDPPEEGEQ